MQKTAAAPVDPSEKKVWEQARALRLRELRAIALHALTTDETDIPVWQYYGELKELRMRPLLAEWFEARIALCLAAEIRPSATVRAIKDLRDLRRRRGQEDKFLAFEALFKNAKGARLLTNHGYGNKLFSDLDHTSVWTRVSGHISVLGERGYDVFLNSGTLLGVVRDQKLIDHDDDIDLAVILNATSAEAAAVEWKELTHGIRALGLLDEENFGAASIIKLLPVEGVQIDLFPAWFEGERVFVYPHTFGELNREDVLPLKPCLITGNPVPAHAERMLEVNYGRGWDKPDPYFKFPWGRANKNFKVFLEALS